MKKRSAKTKGTKFENEVKKACADAGVPNCRRQPYSGALQEFKGDVVIDTRGMDLKVECKHHKTIANYERIERHRDTCDGVLVDTPAGRFYWLTDEAFLDLLSRAYGSKPPGMPVLRLAQLKTGSALRQYDSWLKGCDLLVVKPNHRQPRWWLPEGLFWSVIVNHAAQGSYAEEEPEYDGPYTEESVAAFEEE